jgi:pimeloyl-ACP methyl ester carboxylesterase
MTRLLVFIFITALLAAVPALAQQPRTYAPTPEERQQLDERMKALAERLKSLPGKDLADAAVFLHTAEMADRLTLYTNKAGVTNVLHGLEIGLQRCDALGKGERPWQTQPGRSLRGYVSRIDGSVQPYGVVLPAGFDPRASKPYRLEVFLHGRGPTEVSFLQQWEPATPAKAPEQTYIELQPFGRANNGWRWSGETDVFEALEQVRKQYKIDPNGITLRGFSMGGHGAWQIGVHYPTVWAGVSPGAGFTETRKYMHIRDAVPAYQEAAWHIYDAVDYALNLFNTPFIGYGGENDPQLQATLNMKEAADKEGVPLTVIVGPGTQHRYHPDSLREIMAQLATKTRDPDPKRIKFATWTLKYNQCAWVTVDGLEQHYRKAVVEGDSSVSPVKLRTQNITALTLEPVPTGSAIDIDGQTLTFAPRNVPKRLSLERVQGKWRFGSLRPPHKRHNLQGPIDDAFMERFLVVRGTGTPWHSATGSYAEAALKRFQEEWRLGFRGEVPVKDDREVTATDWKEANLVFFGDPSSNSLLEKIAARLPIKWTSDGIEAAGKKYGPDSLPVLIYPNPLNPDRYIVINSGHTWTAKEIAATNAALTPKLPDWAILKLGSAAPEVLAADFFDEQWKFKGVR